MPNVAVIGPEKTWIGLGPLLAAMFVLSAFGPAPVALSAMLTLYDAMPGPDDTSELEANAICVIVMGPEKALLA